MIVIAMLHGRWVGNQFRQTQTQSKNIVKSELSCDVNFGAAGL